MEKPMYCKVCTIDGFEFGYMIYNFTGEKEYRPLVSNEKMKWNRWLDCYLDTEEEANYVIDYFLSKGFGFFGIEFKGTNNKEEL